MKKFLSLLLVLFSFMSVTSCAFFGEGDGTITLKEYIDDTYYYGDVVSLSDFHLIIERDGHTEEIALTEEEVVKAKGVLYEGGEYVLDTTQVGLNRLVIKYDGLTYTFNFNIKRPEAEIKELSDKVTATIWSTETLKKTDETVDLDVVYSFQAFNDEVIERNDFQEIESLMAKSLKLWHADFVITFSEDVAKDSLVLAGFYEYAKTWGFDTWTGFYIPQDVAANTGVRLLDTAGISVNYDELCHLVQKFLCGITNCSLENVGTTMTAELRLYEVLQGNEETGRSVSISTTSYTIK